MNTNEVAIRCGEHAFTRLQKLLPQQDRLLPKIYQTTDDQYIIYWDSIRWFESSDKGETELVKAFNRAFDYLEKRADILSFGYSGCRPNDNIFPCTFTSYHIKKENSICAEPGECIFSLCMILIIRPTLQPKGDRAANTYQNLRVF